MNIKKILRTAKIQRKIVKQELKELLVKEKELKEKLENNEQARIILQNAATMTQKYIGEHLATITTKALATVFEDPYEFRIEFVERRNSTECDFYFTRNGKMYDPLESCGYGAADVASFALKIAYILMSGKRRILIADEPFKQLDEERIPFAAELVKKLSIDLDFQFIISTHIIKLAELANRIFRITNNSEKSICSSTDQEN